ncbi:hypothetical protein [Flavobacterium branchiicola]|uniref:Uncharacterized protein n=1 Tax=Flavobacterium branchiicola TaxID=1114875 RepID=A0ABV9PFC8_9FLAO|nr:hypothetical protein [Flavobacterium branchiicola]MBS7254220.1 hypothetical protein [Flavobacterium branchiicola]
MEKRPNQDYGLYDPDFIEQNTPADSNGNYFPDEDQYQFQEEFIDDGRHQTYDLDQNAAVRAENIPDKERIVNEDNLITNDGKENDWNDNSDTEDLDYENDLEKDGDLDNDEELDDFDAEHYPENHPRE